MAVQSRTPTLLTPDLDMDGQHNLFENSFKEGQASLNSSKGLADAGARAELALREPYAIQPTTTTASLDPFVRAIQHSSTLSPFFGLSSHGLSPPIFGPAMADDGLRSGSTYVADALTAVPAPSPSAGIAPAAMWTGPPTEVEMAPAPGMLSPPKEHSPVPPTTMMMTTMMMMKDVFPDAWPHAPVETTIDTTCAPIWSRYGQITPPDDDVPNVVDHQPDDVGRREPKPERKSTAAAAAAASSPDVGRRRTAATRGRTGNATDPPIESPKRRGARRSAATLSTDHPSGQPEPALPPTKRRRRRHGAEPTEHSRAAPSPPPPPPPPLPTVPALPSSSRSGAAAATEKAESAVAPAEDERKRNRFLERNRVAASKCRQKKKEWTSKLEGRARSLQLERDQLSIVVGSLKDEVLFLKGEMLKHSNCDCERIRHYLNREADNLAPVPDAAWRRRRQQQQQLRQRRSPAPPSQSPAATNVSTLSAAPSRHQSIDDDEFDVDLDGMDLPMAQDTAFADATRSPAADLSSFLDEADGEHRPGYGERPNILRPGSVGSLS
ncbi:MAG: hypothetical protein M1815_000560 [Lichina confinis]|nr:MAG: hypothetical protein M1815_000560 [Lichina confinis]